MRVFRGKTVSPGFAEGRVAVVNASSAVRIPRYDISASQVEHECGRFREALERSSEELDLVRHRVLSELGEAESGIFAAHLALLQDKKFVEKVKETIARELVNVEQALEAEVNELVGLLCDIENEYLRERSQDIRDIGNRVLRHLGSLSEDEHANIPPESVLVAQELLPSDTIKLDRSSVVALVTEQGGGTTHAAILARSLGIPAVTGVAGIRRHVQPGLFAQVNGDEGSVVLAPTRRKTVSFHQRKDDYDAASKDAEAKEADRCTTHDGHDVPLLGNINRKQEAEDVLRHNLDGVGLFRTEFLFLGTPEAPSCEAQERVYTQTAGLLAGRPLVIRTVDLGGDKKPLFLHREYEANPNLGLRGLRFSLRERELFETQISAILQAAKKHSVQILFPMVIGSEDLRVAVDIVRQKAASLDVDPRPSIGAMIETPAAVYQIGHILRLADFISIGTNDLTQFILAADRYALEMLDSCSTLHPAVMRAISTIVAAGQEHGRPVCVCGEAAGDPLTACLLVALGVRQLSLSPTRAARVRQAIRRISVDKLAPVAQEATGRESVESVKSLLADFEMELGLGTDSH